MTTWHAPPDVLQRYAGGAVDDVTACSIEAHLERCAVCRGALADCRRPDPPRSDLGRGRRPRRPAPRPRSIERVLARGRVRSEARRAWWPPRPRLRLAWLAAVALVVGLVVAACQATGSDGIFLAIAPAPAAGRRRGRLRPRRRARRRGRGGDTPVRVRLVLRRAELVLVTSFAILAARCPRPPRARGRATPPGCCRPSPSSLHHRRHRRSSSGRARGVGARAAAGSSVLNLLVRAGGDGSCFEPRRHASCSPRPARSLLGLAAAAAIVAVLLPQRPRPRPNQERDPDGPLAPLSSPRGLTKRFGATVALDGVDLEPAHGRDRLARPERGRQDHPAAHPRHRPRPRRRVGPRVLGADPLRRIRPARDPPPARLRPAGTGLPRLVQRLRLRRLRRDPQGDGRSAQPPRRGAPGALPRRAGGGDAQADPPAVGRHATAGRHRPGAARRPGPPAVRRADRRPRPGAAAPLPGAPRRICRRVHHADLHPPDRRRGRAVPTGHRAARRHGPLRRHPAGAGGAGHGPGVALGGARPRGAARVDHRPRDGCATSASHRPASISSSPRSRTPTSSSPEPSPTPRPPDGAHPPPRARGDRRSAAVQAQARRWPGRRLVLERWPRRAGDDVAGRRHRARQRAGGGPRARSRREPPPRGELLVRCRDRLQPPDHRPVRVRVGGRPPGALGGRLRSTRRSSSTRSWG